MNKKVSKKGRGRPRLPDGQNARLPSVRISQDQLARYTEAAKRAGLTFAVWVRDALDKAAGRK